MIELLKGFIDGFKEVFGSLIVAICDAFKVAIRKNK